MVQQTTGRFAYVLDTITRKAPVMSGVYTLFSHEACLHVGESDDICASLLEHYYEYDPWLSDKEITHFSFDLAPPQMRGALLIDRIQQLGPTCAQRAGSSGDFHCPPAQKPPSSTAPAMAGLNRT
ncbi:MAG TPA: hypothetical protein VEU07_16290 [Candidatus Acidoferrum sp.]|nr:hypothetical protein [Candidatus Acidoferrum sp.]